MDNLDEIDLFLGGEERKNINYSYSKITGIVKILTSSGALIANPGDWIVKDIDGDFYVYNPAAFAMTHGPEGEPIHAQCHDVVCNGDRRLPRGAKGVCCSCQGREQRLRAALEECCHMFEWCDTRFKHLL